MQSTADLSYKLAPPSSRLPAKACQVHWQLRQADVASRNLGRVLPKVRLGALFFVAHFGNRAAEIWKSSAHRRSYFPARAATRVAAASKSASHTPSVFQTAMA